MASHPQTLCLTAGTAQNGSSSHRAERFISKLYSQLEWWVGAGSQQQQQQRKPLQNHTEMPHPTEIQTDTGRGTPLSHQLDHHHSPAYLLLLSVSRSHRHRGDDTKHNIRMQPKKSHFRSIRISLSLSLDFISCTCRPSSAISG